MNIYHYQQQVSEQALASQEYSDEITNVTEKIEGGLRIVTEHHDNARIPFITVYEYPLDETGAAAVPPAQQVGGTNYYRVTSTNTDEDTGDEVCAIATGSACTGYIDESVTGFNVCSAYNPTAAQVTDVNGDGSVTYCNGAPQTGPCASLTNTCLACPDCAIGVACNESISGLYREMYVTCAAASSDVGLNGGTTTLSTASDLTSQVSVLGSGQGAYTWIYDTTNYLMSGNYPFNAGSTQNDYSGNSRNGSFIGTPDYTTPGGCQVGGCLFFDGVNEQVNTNNTLSTFMNNEEGSVSVWVKPTAAASAEGQAYTGDDIFSSTFYMGLSQANIGGQDRIWAFNWDGGEDRVGASYTINEWAHFVWVHVGGKLRLYKNGALVGEVESGNTQAVNQQVRIGGAASYGKHFEGYIDELQFYPIPLSPDQITQIYSDTSAGYAGPRTLTSEHTHLAQEWDLDITPISDAGAAQSIVNSANVVTITEDSITVGLNSGTTTLDTFTTLESQVTGLTVTGGGYTWTENATPYMELNIPFNSGSTQIDFSGNARNATAASGTSFSPQWQGECQVGGCRFFDGSNDYVNTGSTLSTFMSDTTGTVSVWAKPTAAGAAEGQAYTGDDVWSSTFYAGVSQANVGGEDRFWAFNYDGNEDRIGVTYNVDEWIHLVWVHGGGKLRFYKNGTFAGAVESANTQAMNQQVRIGNAASFGKHFQGYIDEFQMWDKALTDEQIALIYSDGNANVPAPTQLDALETTSADVWDLDVTPLDMDGAVLSEQNSSNTVTISAPSSTLTLNLGGTTLSTFSDLASATTGLNDPQATFTWTENGAPYMSLNYPFNFGATQLDYSGNNDSGGVSGAAFSKNTEGQCKVGGCYFFDGVNDFINTGSTLGAFMTNTEGSVSVWARPTAAAVAEGQAYTGDDIWSSTFYAGISQAVVGGEDRLWAFNWDGNEDRVGATYTVDEWVHLTWVHGGGQLSLYKNGVLVGTVPSGNTQATNQQIRIGNAASFGKHFQGYIDEFQMYDFALTADQALQLYTDGDANVSGPTIIQSQETVAGDSWEVSMTPFEEDGTPLSVVNAGTTVTITIPSTSANINGGNTGLSTSQDLVSAVTGVGDPQLAYTWSENGSPFLTLNYPFNLGATQNDYSGNSYNGTVIQAAFSPDGQGLCQVGGCYFFDGIDDYINTSQTLSAIMSDTSGTVSVWANPSVAGAAEGQAYTGDDVWSSTFYAGISQAEIGGEDRFWAFNWDGDEDRVGATYNVGEWIHLVWVHGGGQLSLYKNGALVGSVTSGNTQATNQQVRVGNAASFGKHFNGYIDEFQSWDFALSANQIEQLYTDGNANLAGPSQIESSETIAADVWSLSVTPFKGDGSALSTVPATNTVTIAAPSVTVTLNNGSGIIDPSQNLPTAVTGLGPAAATYEWQVNSSPFMTLNLPFNPGDTQTDYSGNGRDATRSGASFSVEGQGLCQVGACHFYDGVNDFVNTNNTMSTFLTASEGTVSVWAKPTTAAAVEGQAYTGDDIWSSTFYAGISQATIGGEDRLWAFNWDGDEDRIGATYTVGEWVHLVWMHSGGNLSLYKNGVLVGSVASGDTQATNQQVRIGNAASFGKHFAGYIDEVQMWDFAISEDQIALIYADGLATIAGPTEIADEQITLGDDWSLSVTPFESDGTPFAPNSGNVVSGFINTPPNAPSLVYPADGLTTNILSPELSVTYVDINTGHTGTTEYRVSSGTTTDCVNNVNVVHTGTSAATATINENTVYEIGIVLTDFTTYTWCARNYDTFDYSSGGAFTAMGEFTVDSTYSEGGSNQQKQQIANQQNSQDTGGDDSDATQNEESSNQEETSNQETNSEEDGSQEESQEEESSQQQQQQQEEQSQEENQTETPAEEPTGGDDVELPQQEQDEAPGDGELPPPPQPPTIDESSNLDTILNEIIEQEVQETGGDYGGATTQQQTQNGQTSSGNQTNAQSDGRSFTIEVEDQGDAEVVGDESELVVTGLAVTEEDRIEFSGTTSEPGTTVTLIFNENTTIVVTSDESGQWQTFVSADQLGVQQGVKSNVSIEAIASKENLVSEKVKVGKVELQLIARADGEKEELIAEFESVVEQGEVLTSIQAVQERVVEIIEEQEVVIQQTLAVTAPVVVVASAPLWGYLPYVPTIVYHFMTYLIGLIGRRKQEGEQLYGQVYDSITKKPLGLAVIRVYNKDTNRLVTTKVTDKLGRYDLLLQPGEYRLEATKPQYSFPSQIVNSAPDAQYTVIYNPETGFINEEGSLSVPNIPIDPIDAKRHFALASIIKKPLLLLQRVGHFLAIPVLLVGSLSSILSVAAVPESPENWILAFIYVFLFILQLRLRPHIEKAWGIVSDLATSAVLPLTTIQLIEPEYGKVVTSRLTDYEGRFAFLPEPGKYLLKASKPGYEPSSKDVVVEKEGQRIQGNLSLQKQ